MQSLTAFSLLSGNCGTYRLSFGCSVIDAIFGDRGLHSGITEISGEAGSGKTQICLQLALQCWLPVAMGGLNGATAYMSCGEGEFPIKRLAQMSRNAKFLNLKSGPNSASHTLTHGDKENEISPSINEFERSNQILSSVHIEQCRNSEEALQTLTRIIPSMCQENNIRLLIIDSVAGLVRTEFETKSVGDMAARTSLLFHIALQLKRLIDAYNLCVVVVNQVTATGFNDDISSFKGNGLFASNTVPALGLAWTHCINTRIMLFKSNHAIGAGHQADDDDESQDINPIKDRAVGSYADIPVSVPSSSSSWHDTLQTSNIAIPVTISCHDPGRNTSLLTSKRKMHLLFSPLLQPACCLFEISAAGVAGVST